MHFSLAFSDIYPTLLLFARIGPMLMVLPGFGEAHVNPRIRVLIAVLVSIIVSGLVPVPTWSVDSPAFLQTLFREIGVGLFLGLIARLWLISLQLTANIISLQMSFSNAVMFNPAMATQDSVISSGLMVTAVTLLFLTDMHHRFIEVMIDSYAHFPLAKPLVLNDFSHLVTSIIAKSFVLGVQLSIPFLILGTIFQIGLGFLNRLMPQMQIFFLAMPMQILGGMVVLAFMVGVILNAFVASYDQLYLFNRSE